MHPKTHTFGVVFEVVERNFFVLMELVAIHKILQRHVGAYVIQMDAWLNANQELYLAGGSSRGIIKLIRT